jgi:hypothetical protein
VIRGAKTPLNFGRGKVEITASANSRESAEKVTIEDKKYLRYAATADLEFRHEAQKNSSRPLPKISAEIQEVDDTPDTDTPDPPDPPDPDPVTLVDITVKSMDWQEPVITVSGPPYANRQVKFDYSGSATLTLKFSDNSEKDTTVTNLSASSIAKLEDIVSPFATIVFEEPLGSFFYQVDETIASAESYQQKVSFNRELGELSFLFSISNDSVYTSIRGEQVPLPFGHGTLSLDVEKKYVEQTTLQGKKYSLYEAYFTVVFSHPARNASQAIPKMIMQVIERE